MQQAEEVACESANEKSRRGAARTLLHLQLLSLELLRLLPPLDSLDRLLELDRLLLRAHNVPLLIRLQHPAPDRTPFVDTAERQTGRRLSARRTCRASGSSACAPPRCSGRAPPPSPPAPPQTPPASAHKYDESNRINIRIDWRIRTCSFSAAMICASLICLSFSAFFAASCLST